MSTLLIILTTLILTTLLYLLLRQPTKPSRLPPGPKGWPVLGNLPQLGPKPHQTMAGLARKYGPLIHLKLGSVHAVVASSPATASLFLKTHDANFCNRPPNAGAKHMAYDGQSIAFAPYGPRWRALRKISTSHLLSPKAIDEFRHVRGEEVSRMVAAILKQTVRSAEGGGGVDVGKHLNVCTANAMTRASLGRRLFADGGEGDREATEFKEMVVELTTLAGAFVLGDFIPSLGWLDPQGVIGKMKRVAKRFDGFLDRIVAEHKEKKEKDDFLSVLLKLREEEGGGGDDGERLTDVEIKALLLDLFVAGTDTSASTAEWALAELVRHPSILRRAQQELDSVVGRDRLVSEPDLARLPFLQAVIKETFRLHPSTPLSLPHMATDDCEINGYHIPSGSTLFVNVWAIARDPDVWADPLEFNPARFLSGGPKAHVDVRGNDFEVIPFGSGRRICAGINLGLRMVQFMTATLVHAFDWAGPDGLDPEKIDMEEAYGLTLQRAVPLRARLTPRLASHVYRAS
ncbi:Flavonoid 3'-monooxygenase [Acorus calamus]|uniref:Flavonoid 3'-monooxygenase n=1 Tax=Acorus calamus TaxID=4465 RepID=A0AAV9D6M3_ACOCL|nr:Flavonoid 3'-monooxygenase [Acorus calamus]